LLKHPFIRISLLRNPERKNEMTETIFQEWGWRLFSSLLGWSLLRGFFPLTPVSKLLGGQEKKLEEVRRFRSSFR
jgi:hypothetical protein